jgi:hypothetical protein
VFQGTSLCPSPADALTFYASNYSPFGAPQGGGLFKTTDGGQTWASTGYAATAHFVECDQTDPQTLYITQPGSGGVGERALRSQDAGVTFQDFSEGLPNSDGGARWLAYAPGTTPKLLMATTTGSYGRELGEACYANCDQSTMQPILNVNDFICFQSKFAAGDPYANCDGSTQPPVLNVNDFICFQGRFAAGCP